MTKITKKDQISNLKPTNLATSTTAQNVFLTKDYLAIQKIIEDLRQFIEGVKKKEFTSDELYLIQDSLRSISTSIFVDVTTYQHQKVMDTEVLNTADAMTFYEALKTAQTLAMDSENCEMLNEHGIYLEILRSYFLKIHLFDLERFRNKSK